MSRLRCFVGLIGILAIATICLNLLTEQRNAAFAADDSADLLKRLEVLEARVASLELQRLPPTHATRVPSTTTPKNWSQREFNGSPVYIIPLAAGDKPD